MNSGDQPEQNGRESMPESYGYQLIVRHACVGMYLKILEGCFVSVNPAMARLYGFDSPEEMLAASRAHQGMVPPFGFPLIAEALRIHNGDVTVDAWLEKKDGSCFPGLVTARYFQDPETGIDYVTGTIVDMTDKVSRGEHPGAGKEWGADCGRPFSGLSQGFTGKCRGRVLLVEDEEYIREVMVEVLQSSGFDVVEAVNGQDALDIVAAHDKRVDLVVMDLNMPVMGGKECMAAMLKMCPGLIILVATGSSDMDEVDEIRSLGAKNIISKPYTSTQLLEAIQEFLF